MISYIIGFCIGIAIYYTVKRVLHYKSEKTRPRSTFLELMNQAVHELNLVEKFKNPNFTIADGIIGISTSNKIFGWFRNKTGHGLSPQLEVVALVVIIRDLKSENGFDRTLSLSTRIAINEWFERDIGLGPHYSSIDTYTITLICEDVIGNQNFTCKVVDKHPQPSDNSSINIGGNKS